MNGSAFAPILDFLRRHTPFDQMAPAHQELLAKRLRLGFYAQGESIVSPELGPADRFYIIKQGRVRGSAQNQEPGDEDGTWELVAGECFPIGALLSRRPVRLVQRAEVDTFCFELDRAGFDELLQLSPVFQDFCTRRLANLLDSALKTVQARSATRAAEGASLSAPLRSLIKRPPVTCREQDPVRLALERMQREHIGSIVITDDAQRPKGVFTLHDVLARVALPQLDLATPIGQVMTPSIISLSSDAPAYQAAVLMTRHGFGHLCVVDQGALAGVVSERDLFSLQRVGLVSLARTIGKAPDVPALVAIEDDIHRLVEQMQAQGASVDQLIQITTELNDAVTQRVIALAVKQEGADLPPFTWLAFGSEGRIEQTLSTDQDNGILFQVPPDGNAETLRARLLPVARRINDVLAQCGYPLCKGNIMAGNPECCLSADEWRARFERWVAQGTPEHLLNASIFFDFRPLYGDPAPAEALRREVQALAGKNPRFLHQMAVNALRNRPPLGLVRDFQVSSGGDHPNTLDLKVQGTTPFVDAARIFALAGGVAETNTVRRLAGTVERGALNKEEVAAWTEAYQFILLLRMRGHRRQREAGETLDNYLNPDELNDLDRRILKEAFRQARKLQSRLALDYRV